MLNLPFSKFSICQKDFDHQQQLQLKNLQGCQVVRVIFGQRDEIKCCFGQQAEELPVLILTNPSFRIKIGFRIVKTSLTFYLSVLLVCRLNEASILYCIHTWLRYFLHKLEG